MFYGEPRLTNDVDIVVSLAEAELPGFEAAFPDAEFYRPPREVLLVELGRSRRGHFNLIDHRTGFKADIYLAGLDPNAAKFPSRCARWLTRLASASAATSGGR